MNCEPRVCGSLLIQLEAGFEATSAPQSHCAQSCVSPHYHLVLKKSVVPRLLCHSSDVLVGPHRLISNLINSLVNRFAGPQEDFAVVISQLSFEHNMQLLKTQQKQLIVKRFMCVCFAARWWLQSSPQV